MPRTKQQFQQMRSNTREKIRAAAIALFARQGLEATSVQDIAEAAGMSAGLLYRHYRSKDDLFMEIANDSRDGLAHLREAFDQGDPLPTLSGVAEDVCRELRENTAFCDIMILISRALLMGDQRLAPLVEEDRRMLASLAGLIARGQQSGAFRAGDPRAMACAFISALQGAFLLHSALGEAYAPPDAATLLAIVERENI